MKNEALLHLLLTDVDTIFTILREKSPKMQGSYNLRKTLLGARIKLCNTLTILGWMKR